MDILQKIKEANVVGRGGADFPAWKKWETAKDAQADIKYVICNSSEGELGLFKDLHIWRAHPDKVIKGLKIVMDFLDTKECYININEDYYKELQGTIHKEINNYRWYGYKFNIFLEHPSYIGGDAGAILNAIEGKGTEPRYKFQRTAVAGLFGKPTIVHNVETLHDIANVYDGTFEGKRYSGIFGDGMDKKIVTHHPADWTIKQILEYANAYPKFDFFVHIGGSASGKVLNKSQLDKEKMVGAGSIEIFDKKKRGTMEFLKRLFAFYANESCGKCTPCREGSYQLNEIIKKTKKESSIDWKEILSIVEVMEKTSFCGLGKGIAQPIHTYRQNILKLKK